MPPPFYGTIILVKVITLFILSMVFSVWSSDRSRAEQTPKSIINKFKMFDRQLDGALHEVVAETGVYTQSKQQVKLRKIVATIRPPDATENGPGPEVTPEKDQSERQTYTLHAPSGLYDLNLAQITFYEDVVIETTSGFEIKTPELVWKINDRKLISFKDVSVKSKDLNVTSVGCDLDLTQDLFKLSKSVQLTFAHEKVNAQTGRYSFSKKEASFSGNVQGEGLMGKWKSKHAVMTMEPAEESFAVRTLQLNEKVKFVKETSKKEQGLSIEANELVVNQKAQPDREPRIRARGKVVANQNELGMEAQSLSVVEQKNGSEEMILEGTEDGRGPVKLIHKERTALSRSARIFMGQGEVNLSENASIESNGDRLEGRRITFYLQSDKVEVKEAVGSLSK